MGKNQLLIVEDDIPFQQRLARAMEKRGFYPVSTDNVEDALKLVESMKPAFAVVDMRLGEGNGLKVIEAIHEQRQDSRAIILTGYGNLASAVNAVKMGAVDYLAKPADPDEIYAALIRERDEETIQRQPSLHRKNRCLQTGSDGSTFKGFTSSVTGMFLKLQSN